MGVRPLVSVIMPAYNVAGYVGEAIESALQQTVADLEIIVIDDGSVDGTATVVRDAQRGGGGRIKLIQQRNGGLSAARNTALDAARGKYLALLDSDDLWTPTFLATQLQTLECEPSVDIVTANAWFLGGPKHKRPVRPHPDPRPQPTLRQIIADEEAVFVMSVFRRSVLRRVGRFNEGFRTNEDYDFWLRAAAAGCVFWRNSTPCGWYRVRAESLSADQVRMLQGILAVYRSFRRHLKPGSAEIAALDRQVIRFEAELYTASARVGAAPTHRLSHREFLGACLDNTLPPKTAVSGAIARYAPRFFQSLDRIRSGARTRMTPRFPARADADDDTAQPPVDRAGKDYWEGVWQHVDFPPEIDPTSHSIWAHRDQVFHRFFREQFAAAPPGLRLLELGCARSAWLPYFAREFGCQVSGLDYAEVGVRQTAERMRQLDIPADIRCGDLFDPPADWIGAFDVVTWFGVAEHFEETARGVRAAAAYVKPGGFLITEIPNMSGLVGMMQRLFNKPVYDIHVPLNGPQLAESHLAAGLEVLAARYLVPTDFGVVNLENLPDSLTFRIKDKVLYGLRLVSGCVWWLDRRIGPLQPGRITSGFVIVSARKPSTTSLHSSSSTQTAIFARS